MRGSPLLHWLRSALLPGGRIRFDLRLAARGVLGLTLPIAAAYFFAAPWLIVTGFAAFLLVFGDLTGAEDPGQMIRLMLGAVFGAMVLAAATLAAPFAPAAVAGMFILAMAVGLSGVYGEAAASMGLPVVWSYVAFGLPMPSHGVREAALGAGFYLGGGLWAIGLAWLVGRHWHHAALRRQVADCYAEMARFLAGPLRRGDPSEPGPVAPETPLREALTRAHRVAAEIRVGGRFAGRAAQPMLVLLSLADRLCWLSTALGHCRPPERGDSAEATLIEGARQLALVIHQAHGRGDVLGLSHRLAAIALRNSVSETDALQSRIASELATALDISSQTFMPAAVLAAVADEPRATRLLRPLIAALDWRDPVCRHALRYAVATSAAVALQYIVKEPFSYWIPFTVSVVLSPYSGSTITKAVQRLLGTFGGVLVAIAVLFLCDAWPVDALMAAAALSLSLSVWQINFGWGVFCLSAGIVPVEVLLTHHVGLTVGLDRMIGNGLGGALALLSNRLLWPASETVTLSGRLEHALRRTADYTQTTLLLAPDEDVPVEWPHRAAGQANTELQLCLGRVASELTPQRLQAFLAPAIRLQRMMSGLSVILVAQNMPSLRHPAAEGFAQALVAELRSLADALRSGKTPFALDRALVMRLESLPRTEDRPAIMRLAHQVLSLHQSVVELVELLAHGSAEGQPGSAHNTGGRRPGQSVAKS